MEKRAILAFILMLIVLFIFQTYFPPKPQQPKEKVEKKTEKKDLPSKPVFPKRPPKEITVQNQFLRITFTDAGGGIKSVKLKMYKESVKDDREKEIIEDIRPYSSIPAIVGAKEEEIVCEAKVTNTYVQEKPEDIIFTCSLPEGAVVRKAYRIYPSEYFMDVKIEAKFDKQRNLELEICGISSKKKSFGHKGPFVFDGKSLEQIEKIDKRRDHKGNYVYAGLDEGYFATIWIPKGDIPSLAITKTDSGIPAIRLIAKSDVAEGRLFFGPKKKEILRALNVKAERIIDFGWFDIIAKPLVALLNFSHKISHNYGIDIIILTLIIKIIFHPLTVKSYKSMKEMQRLQPQIMKLREKYKDNREKLNQELMELYRRRGINPMSGCLPMLVQIPVFFALYKVLTGAIELRQAPFVLWIKDLSEPEDLFSFTIFGLTIPVRVLPLVMGITQVIQQKMTPTGGDPLQEKVMLFMPIFFTFLFWGFPSGLVLYWLVNNVLSIFQQLMINKKLR